MPLPAPPPPYIGCRGPADASQSPGDTTAAALSKSAVRDLDARLRSGDAEALAALFAASRPRLQRVADFRLDPRLRARLDAEDVLQETFLAASRRLRHYADSPYTSPFLWFRALLQQTLVDLHRRYLSARMRDPRREVRLDAPTSPHATSTCLAIQLIGEATSPGEAAARADMLATMETAIGGMAAIDQEVLALRHFEELSNGEVAEALGIQPKAAPSPHPWRPIPCTERWS